MGGSEVNPVTQGSPNYGASVPISAQAIRSAVAKLKAYNIIDEMMVGFYSQALLSKMDAWTLDYHDKDMNDRPDWIRKLEKEWGIR